MKQVLQNLKSGALMVDDVPAPLVRAGHVLIETTCSLISAGTERSVVDFGRANYFQKALQKPDKVRQVLAKIKTDGLAATIDAVNARLDQPMALGYSNVGRVIAVGEGVEDFQIGDRVVSNGRHAEIVAVPVNLCARIPDTVDDATASFTVVSAIALQGIRLVNPTLGEYVCVMGLGLIGLIAAQMLRANGARVIGFDHDPARVKLAGAFGIEALDLSTGIDPVIAALDFSNGQGIDGVLITAATKSNDVIRHAAQMSRKRGRVVLTGVIGLDLDRNDFYEKELTFQVSCSYGPGRYDPVYEDMGQDYPLPFVRWTQQRNFEAALHMMASGALDVSPLLSVRLPLADAKTAYDMLADRSKIGILLDYPAPDAQKTLSVVTTSLSPALPAAQSTDHMPTIGLIGAGGFTMGQVLPSLKAANAKLGAIASAQGVSASHAARKFGITRSTTDYKTILADETVDGVIITTRHDSHARFVNAALAAGKHVFVEKPLCLTADELSDITANHATASEAAGKELILMVGFNRRFSPLTTALKSQMDRRQGPATLTFTVNAGFIPPDHWTQDPAVGGGRLIGEGCHFIDYLRFLVGSPIKTVSVAGAMRGGPTDMRDSFTVTLAFEDGSLGTVIYVATGNKAYPKERCEAFFNNKVFVLDNFKSLSGYGAKGFKNIRLFRQDKGHAAGFKAFIDGIRAGTLPIPRNEIYEVTEKTLEAWNSLKNM